MNICLYDFTNIMNRCHTNTMNIWHIILPVGAVGNDICTVVAQGGPRLGKYLSVILDMIKISIRHFFIVIATMT